MTNSQRKGKNGELELCRWLRDRGHHARRGRQFSGSPDSPDVVCESLPGIHIEVKRCERLRIHDAIEQATADSGPKVPLVAHRRNRNDWLAILRLSDLIDLLERRP